MLLCMLQFGHEDWVFDLKWLDDQIVVSGQSYYLFVISTICQCINISHDVEFNVRKHTGYELVLCY